MILCEIYIVLPVQLIWAPTIFNTVCVSSIISSFTNSTAHKTGFFFGFSYQCYLLIILVLNLSWNAYRGWINFIYFNIWALWPLFFYIKKYWFGLLAHNCFINDMWLYSSYYNINCMYKHEINTSVEVLCRNGAGEILKWDVLFVLHIANLGAI